MPRLTIELANRIEEVRRLVETTEDFAQNGGVPPAVVARFALALDELATNVISYAFNDDLAHIIQVELALEDGRLSAELIDDGRAFDPLQADAPDMAAALDDRPIGGLGIHIVRKTMDVVRYQRDGNKNRLTIAKVIG
ncbi:MAG: ATP-binding protein [Acetobacteraceae bacterium]|nr:ATP-binding protein [Acetobacteraceae bacterium]